MTHGRYVKCRHCGVKASDGFRISKRGKCELCAYIRMMMGPFIVTALDEADPDIRDRILKAAAGAFPPGVLGELAAARERPQLPPPK